MSIGIPHGDRIDVRRGTDLGLFEVGEIWS